MIPLLTKTTLNAFTKTDHLIDHQSGCGVGSDQELWEARVASRWILS